MLRSLGVLAVTAVGILVFVRPATADTFGPVPPANRYLGPTGTATMHGDAASSDTTPYPGPGAGPVDSRFTILAAACPTILQGSDGMPQALCTTIVDRTPTVHLLDPATGASLASLPLVRGSLLGGVYAYVDDRNAMVTVDGSGRLLRIGHDRDSAGAWRLFVESTIDIAGAVTRYCGAPGCDAVSSVMPAYDGSVWFATDRATVGAVDPESGVAHSISLGADERVANSISSTPGGVAVATDHALYLLRADVDGTPYVVWRRAYDRGPARKPGQLSWGTGATPTFFGPATGAEYVAITDNAVPQENLLVYETDSGRPVCSVPATDGTENSPVASGSSVFVASTYGYDYPALPPDAGASSPPTAPFTGGLTRIDLMSDGGCTVRWRNSIRSAAVPRLSVSDGILYTFTRDPLVPGGDSDSPADTFAYVAVDPESGAILARRAVGVGLPFDTLQMVGTIAPGRILYQGTTTGLFRVS